MCRVTDFIWFSPQLHNAKAQQPATSTNSSSNPSLNETNPNVVTITANNAHEVISESYNTIFNGSKGNLSTVLLNQIVRPTVLENMGDKSIGGVSIVVGVITPNGTSVSGYGNISNANGTRLDDPIDSCLVYEYDCCMLVSAIVHLFAELTLQYTTK